jgi:hypothetical protein
MKMARTSTQTSPLAASSTELSDAEALDFSARVVVALLMAYNVQLSDIATSEDKTFGVPKYLSLTQNVQDNVIRLMNGEVLNEGTPVEMEMRDNNKFFELTIETLIDLTDKIRNTEH